MEHFYVVLPSDSSNFYFPRNTISNFRTKLATPIEIEPDKWEVGLIEISYPKGYKKRVQQNILRLGSSEIKFPVRHYKSLNDLIVTVAEFLESSAREEFIATFNDHINQYLLTDWFATDLLKVCYEENSLQIDDKIVSHFPVRMYDRLDDLAKAVMKLNNYRSFAVSLPAKDNSCFTTQEAVYVYTDVIKPNLVGDSYVRLLTTLHFPSKTGYHRFDYPLYRPVEQSFIESIAIRLVTKTGEDVAFDNSAIPSLVILHFKKKSPAQ